MTGRELPRLTSLILVSPHVHLPPERPRWEAPSAPVLHQKLLETLAPPSILIESQPGNPTQITIYTPLKPQQKS